MCGHFMLEQLANHIQKKISVDQEELNTILAYFKPLTVKKNEMLLMQGQTSQRTYFVGKGCLRIYFINDEGQEATRYIAFEDQFAMALTSFITGEPSAEFIQAVEPSDLLYISHTDFLNLSALVPQWEKFHRRYVEWGYVNMTNRLMSFLTQSAHERYRQLLNENPAIIQRLSNKLVASYLNISQETLSRLKGKS